MSIAKTILQQLGGGKFIVMTGAKNFIFGENSLIFRLPSNFARDGINAIKITLDASDTYTMRYMKIRGANLKEMGEESFLYCDQLQTAFKARTGLDTRI